MFIKQEVKRLKKEISNLRFKLDSKHKELNKIQDECKHDYEQTGSCGYDYYYTCKICEKELIH